MSAADAAKFYGERLDAIEVSLDCGSYAPGPWRWLVEELRDSPTAVSVALSDRISRVSRKLHQRRHRYTIGVLSGVLLEALAGIVGGILVAGGIAGSSNWMAITGMLLWALSFEPLLKVGVGTAFGIAFDYAYLYGRIEPRFKLNFGSYLSTTPFKRAVFHFAGTVGSPLGALFAALLFASWLPTAHLISLVVFWLTVAVNVGSLGAAIAGVRQIGGFQLSDSSSTMALIEMRCWLRIKRAS